MAIINGYTLVEPPFQGGMALVYKGTKGAFSKAFKMVRPDKAANNPILCERFLTEIKLQTQLEHPNIIKILDAYPYTNTKGITVTILEMEWLNGMDLQRYIDKFNKHGLNSKAIIKIANQIIDGLEYAHQHSILHLDIKPSNLFRTIDGYIKIIDFGIAKIIGENANIVDGAENLTMITNTGESSFKGTMAFASPEQQVGGKLSFTSDIYSFGKTIHFLATGSTDPSIEIEDTKLNSIVTKCTMQNPKHRYQTFSEVRNAFSEKKEDIKCPHCGVAITKDAKFCSNCGKEISKEQTKEKCPQCGKIRNTDDQFCDTCGWDYSQTFVKKKIMGYKCNRCNKVTPYYSDGKVNFCNYCGASKENFIIQYSDI